MQFSAVQCSAVQCSSVHWSACSAIQFSAIQCSAVQCSAVHCSEMKCSAVQCAATTCWECSPCYQCSAITLSVWQQPCSHSSSGMGQLPDQLWWQSGVPCQFVVAIRSPLTVVVAVSTPLVVVVAPQQGARLCPPAGHHSTFIGFTYVVSSGCQQPHNSLDATVSRHSHPLSPVWSFPCVVLLCGLVPV